MLTHLYFQCFSFQLTIIIDPVLQTGNTYVRGLISGAVCCTFGA